MKARLEAQLPTDDHWCFEVKLDGIRAIAVKTGKKVALYSRRPRDISAEYPEIVSALASLPVHSLVLDGEIVALESGGRTSFQALQNARSEGRGKQSLFYYCFDLLHMDGRDMMGLPMQQRRAILTAVLPGGNRLVRLAPILEGTPTKIWSTVEKMGYEGVIAKQKDSVYESGRRSGAWMKIKRLNEQEFVIGGYTPPEGSRAFFGALLLGVYEGEKLAFVSRVGTGFNNRSLKSLFDLFQPFKIETCPFWNLPTQRSGKFGQGVTQAEMRRCVWLKPRLVCQVRFLEWTGDNSLRQPVFIALRQDKKPREVVRERAAQAAL
jgi:bifunctional non-homologous end joining protein LigD